MPKSRKRKNQDFQKVKLKVGKRLPKGENVMNLSFQTRRIQLTQRIKEDSQKDIVTEKKLSVQDLLRMCDHPSTSARVNAVSGLKEVWLGRTADLLAPTNVFGHAAIVAKLAGLLIDNEMLVRRSTVSLLKLILTRISSDSSENQSSDRLEGRLYSHIHAYLCCALNHIHEDIRQDALVVFDTLLDCFPRLMVQQTGDLLKNLIGLIASPSFMSTKGSSTPHKLSLNPDSKLQTTKFHVQVLARVKRILWEAVRDENRLQQPSQGQQVQHRVSWSSSQAQGIDQSQQNTLLVSSLAASRFALLFLGGCHELDEYITKPSVLEEFMKMCVPVLLQCWREAQAAGDYTHSVRSGMTFTAELVEVMSLVVSIIQLMFSLCSRHQKTDLYHHHLESYCISPEILVKNYQKDFEKLLFAHFPYCPAVTVPLMKKKKKSKTVQLSDSVNKKVSSVEMNLAICDIVSSFCAYESFQPGADYLKKIQDFVVTSFHGSPSLEHINILTRTLRNLFCHPHLYELFTAAYSAAVRYYLNCSVKSHAKKACYYLLAFMVRTWDGWPQESDTHNYLCQKYKPNQVLSGLLQEFLATLPTLLVDLLPGQTQRELVVDVLQLMAHGHVQKHSQAFHESFQSKLSALLDPLTGIHSCNDEEIWIRFFSLLSKGCSLTEDHLKQVLYLIRRPADQPLLPGRHSSKMSCEAIDSIVSCFRNSVPLSCREQFNNMSTLERQNFMNYLRFMFSLQIGFTGEELEVVCSAENTSTESPLFAVDFSVQDAQWQRHLDIISFVARELVGFSIPALPSLGFHEKFYLFDLIEQLWKQTFVNRSKMHILSALSLIQYLHQATLSCVANKLSPEMYQLAAKTVVSVLSGVCAVPSDLLPAPTEHVVWKVKSEVIQLLSTNQDLLGLVMELLATLIKNSASPKEVEQFKSVQFFLTMDESLRLKQAGSPSPVDSSVN